MLLSGLMVTQWRREDLAAEALDCWRRQTIRCDRELVIVSNDPVGAARLAPEARVLWSQPGMLLGELRQLAVDAARGEFVAQWDDDDLSAPERLDRQLDAVGGHNLCCLSRVTLRCRCGFECVSHRRPWPNTMLARRLALPHYRRDVHLSEDIDMLSRAPEPALLGEPGLFTYRHTGRGTWGAGHWVRLFELAGHPHDVAACERMPS